MGVGVGGADDKGGGGSRYRENKHLSSFKTSREEGVLFIFL